MSRQLVWVIPLCRDPNIRGVQGTAVSVNPISDCELLFKPWIIKSCSALAITRQDAEGLEGNHVCSTREFIREGLDCEQLARHSPVDV